MHAPPEIFENNGAIWCILVLNLVLKIDSFMIINEQLNPLLYSFVYKIELKNHTNTSPDYVHNNQIV